jgi:hypothetical protein
MVAPLVALAKAYAVGKAKDYATSKAEEALGLPKDSIGVATNPMGFAKNILKDVAKDYAKNEILGRDEIPEEDRSRPDPSDSGSREYSDDFGKYGLGVSEFGGGMGGGGKSFFDNEGMSTSAMKRGGKVKSATKSNTASRRGDGIAQRGKTRGRYL